MSSRVVFHFQVLWESRSGGQNGIKKKVLRFGSCVSVDFSVLAVMVKRIRLSV